MTFARLTRSARRFFRLRDAAVTKLARWLDALAAQRERRRQTRTRK